jgi:hypothetical protein
MPSWVLKTSTNQGREVEIIRNQGNATAGKWTWVVPFAGEGDTTCMDGAAWNDTSRCENGCIVVILEGGILEFCRLGCFARFGTPVRSLCLVRTMAA